MTYSVIAIDKDPVKIACAKQNAAIYGVENIQFIVDDFFESTYEVPVLNELKKS
jgi:predicted RNA methylase